MISQNDTVTLPGLKKLWAETTGSPDIVIAVLDGPVDLSHPCFKGADLHQLSAMSASSEAGQGIAAQHGTHVASIIFGQHESDVKGIAPKCRGLLLPVFTDEPNGGLAPCSQIDLARAITQAVEAGAHVINISGGQLVPSGEADRLLMNAIRLCQERDVLLVAAAGNDGCDCLHVPAALETVLAVGGMDSQGRPVSASNWGKAYQSQGILAPGENILGALPSGGTVRRSGTSFAAPIVAGVACLLLSLQRQQGKQPSPHAVREILLRNVLPCNLPEGTEQQRCLAGRLNVSGSHLSLTNSAQGGSVMSENEAMVMPSACGCGAAKEEEVIEQAAAAEAEGIQPSAVAAAPAPAAVTPSAGCPSCPGGAKLVYALGELGTDFGSEARKDSFTQDMMGASLLDYLAKNPWAAQNLIWTLNLDATPIYAIVPQGPFASVAYERLREFLADGQIERVSIPGYIGGTIKLMSGQTVPVIVPEVRGMYSWTLGALAEAAVSNMRASAEVSEERARMADSQLRDYLNRVYYDYRNLGITPQERALNFSATNAFQITSVLVTETNEGQRRVLDEITVEKSPLCRPDSDCYDVKLTFFDPDNTLRSRRVYRYTVDVSEVLPVTIGKVRSWAQS